MSLKTSGFHWISNSNGSVMKQILILSCVLAGYLPALGQDLPFRTLSYYDVLFVGGKSDSDMRLSEAVWKDIPISQSSYEYLKTTPNPGAVQSDLQLAYDESGIHLKITNHEKQMDRLRAVIQKRDPSLWTDDSVQMYFDPKANGVGYVAFTVNSLGVQDDYKRWDAAVTLQEWRGDNWKAWVRKEEAAWVIEAFFPYSDLGEKAVPNAIWMFNWVRHAYTTDQPRRASWSCGGTYATPGYFGYIRFVPPDGLADAPPEAVGKALKGRATPPWMTVIGDHILLQKVNTEAEALKIDEVQKRSAESMLESFSRLKGLRVGDSAFSEQILHLENQGTNLHYTTPNQALESFAKVGTILAEAQQLYWQEKLQILLEDTAPR